MKQIFITTLALFFFFHVSYAQDSKKRLSTMGPRLFDTKAEFAVDNNVKQLSSVVAIIEEHPTHGPEYFWMEISFYPFLLTEEEIESAKKGNWEPIKNRRHEVDYNSHAEIVLSMDKNYKVWQVDMAMPGYSCTIAPFEEDVKRFLQEYQFDGEHLKLKSKGTYNCGTLFEEVTDWTFSWDINFDIPVFKK